MPDQPYKSVLSNLTGAHAISRHIESEAEHGWKMLPVKRCKRFTVAFAEPFHQVTHVQFDAIVGETVRVPE